MDKNFQNADIINFAIINRRCKGTHLQNSEKYNKTILKSDLAELTKEKKEKFECRY